MNESDAREIGTLGARVRRVNFEEFVGVLAHNVPGSGYAPADSPAGSTFLNPSLDSCGARVGIHLHHSVCRTRRQYVDFGCGVAAAPCPHAAYEADETEAIYRGGCLPVGRQPPDRTPQRASQGV